MKCTSYTLPLTLFRLFQCRGKSQNGRSLRPRSHIGRHRSHPRRCVPSPFARPCSHPVDITYASLAKAFHQQLSYHPETLTRMEQRLSLPQNDDQRKARMRMALFPHAAEVLFVAPDLWVVCTPFTPWHRSHALPARRPTRGKTLRLSRHPLPLSENARQPQTLSPPPTPTPPSVPSTGIHKVRHASFPLGRRHLWRQSAGIFDRPLPCHATEARHLGGHPDRFISTPPTWRLRIAHRRKSRSHPPTRPRGRKGNRGSHRLRGGSRSKETLGGRVAWVIPVSCYFVNVICTLRVSGPSRSRRNPAMIMSPIGRKKKKKTCPQKIDRAGGRRNTAVTHWLPS